LVPLKVAPAHDPGSRVSLPAASAGVMTRRGCSSVQLRLVVVTVMPVGGVEEPEKVGIPP